MSQVDAWSEVILCAGCTASLGVLLSDLEWGSGSSFVGTRWLAVQFAVVGNFVWCECVMCVFGIPPVV